MLKPMFGIQLGNLPIYQLMLIIGCFVGMIILSPLDVKTLSVELNNLII